MVVDASVVLEVLLGTPDSGRIAQRLFDRRETLHAPHLLDVEVAQVLRRYAGRGELSADHGHELLALLAEFPITRYPHQPLLGRIWELRGNLTAYDAAYLALAEALRAVFLTRDERLSKAPGLAATIELA